MISGEEEEKEAMCPILDSAMLRDDVQYTTEKNKQTRIMIAQQPKFSSSYPCILKYLINNPAKNKVRKERKKNCVTTEECPRFAIDRIVRRSSRS